jgi:hypothetical protein
VWYSTVEGSYGSNGDVEALRNRGISCIVTVFDNSLECH